jgi:hypothetical protein
MKRSGSLNGSEPGSETKQRVAGEHSLTRSDAGRARSPSPPSPTARTTAPPPSSVAAARIEIVLKPRGRGRFDAFFDGRKIVAASSQAISNAARVLHGAGYPDDALLVARHDGADCDAISGPLGVWRKVRVREDRGPPRHVPWEPFPSRRVRGAKREIAAGGRGSRHAVGAPSKQPGAPGTVVGSTDEEIATREALS